MKIIIVFLQLFFVSISAIAIEKDIVHDSDLLFEEQIREQSCTLTEHELIELTKNILKQNNISYEACKETINTSRRLIAALRALTDNKGEANIIYKNYELEKHGVDLVTWNGYTKRYTTKEKIAALEKVIPENDSSFYRMLSESFKVPAERWLLVRRILMNYDKHHDNEAEVNDEIKLNEWWAELVKTRVSDNEYRNKLCNYLISLSLQIIKEGRQFEEPLKFKLQTTGKEHE